MLKNNFEIMKQTNRVQKHYDRSLIHNNKRNKEVLKLDI